MHEEYEPSPDPEIEELASPESTTTVATPFERLDLPPRSRLRRRFLVSSSSNACRTIHGDRGRARGVPTRAS